MYLILINAALLTNAAAFMMNKYIRMYTVRRLRPIVCSKREVNKVGQPLTFTDKLNV